jgi:hypothetical protein
MNGSSESFHLQAASQDAGVELLRSTGVHGSVFPAENGWVTLLPRDETGSGGHMLARMSSGLLLHLLLSEGRGWMFELYRDGLLASSYLCRLGDTIFVDDRRLNSEAIVDLVTRRGMAREAARDEVERVLRPNPQDGTWNGHGFDPGQRFADLLQLPNLAWTGRPLSEEDAASLGASNVG